MDAPELFGRFAIILLIGALIGLEREPDRLREEVKAFAGIRTFPLIALLGAAAALVSDQTAGWIFGLFLLLLGAFVAIAYGLHAVQGRVGLASESAAIGMTVFAV